MFFPIALCLLSAFATSSLAAPASCPDGWSGLANTTDGSVRCFSFRSEKLIPINTDFFCRSLVNQTAASASVHSLAEADFVISLQSPASCVPFAIGGVVGNGERAWFDQSPFDYVGNLAPSSEGCLIMGCNGAWSAVSCSDRTYPFVCALKLVPTSPTDPGATVPPEPTMTLPTEAPHDRPERPPFSETRCPPLWQFNALSGKCYRYYNNTAYSMQQAESFCGSQHPKGHLTSVYDEEENIFVSRMGLANGAASGIFLGGLFMSNSAVGSWTEDAWFSSAAFAMSSPSSPAWPTPENRYYSNWATGEPAESFGCLRISSSDGRWYHSSCQVALPFVCSFINDGSTFPPEQTELATTVPTTTMQPAVVCAEGWIGVLETQRCYKLLKNSVSGFRANDLCQGSVANAPANSIHATPVTSAAEIPLFSKMLGSSALDEAFVGVAFISYGADGIFTDLATDWDPHARFVGSLWAIGQPDIESGCVVMGRDGSIRAVGCSDVFGGAICSYSSSVNMPVGGTTRPPLTSTFPPDMVGLVTSLSNRNHLIVSSNTRGVYTVQYARGHVEGRWLLFSPNGDCSFGERQGYAVPIYEGKVAVSHKYPVVNGSVCFSPDGVEFFVTGVTFSVLDVSLTGIIPTGFSDWRTGRAVSFSTPLLSEISIQRRSSGVLYIVGRNIMDGLRAVRFASSPDCMESLYVYGSSVLNVTGELATFELIDIQPLNFSTVTALDNRASTDPVFRYFVCVSVSAGADPLFTQVPGLTVTVPVMPVRMDGFITSNGSTVSTLYVNQYATPAVQLAATGLNVAMLFYLSSDPNRCSFIEDLPVYPDPYDSESLRRISTALPVYIDSSVVGRGTPYIRFTLNHTRLEGYPIGGEDVTFHLCIAMTSYEPPKPTTFKVIIKRQTVRSLLLDGDDATNSSHATTTINAGFTGMVRLAGLSFDGLSLETLSTLRVGFAPSSPASLSHTSGNPCANQSAFYRGLTFPVVDTRSLGNSSIGSDAAIILAPNVVDRAVARKLHVCLSVVHAHDAKARTFLPSDAFLDIRGVEVYYLGSSRASPAEGDGYATVEVPENSENFILPVSGYGLRSDMTFFVARSPCFLDGRDPDAYMAAASLLNMSTYASYDVPLGFRADGSSTGHARTVSPFLVLTRAEHTDSSVATRLFGTVGQRQPLWMCLRTPGIVEGVIAIPFRFMIRVPYVTSVVRADNPLSSGVVYSSTVDLIVTGFGLKAGLSRLIPAIDCNDQKSHLWWAAVPLTTVPLTAPVSKYTRSTNEVDGIGSYFLSLTPHQTARIGSLLSGQTQRAFKWCAQYDPSLSFVEAAAGYNYTLTVPTLAGFVNASAPEGVATALSLVTVPVKGSDYTAFSLVGDLLDSLSSVDNAFYLAFMPMHAPCESVTTNASDAGIDRWIVVEDGSAVILPSQIPPIGTYRVCFSTVLPTLSMGSGYEATLRFVDATGLRLVVSAPAFSLRSINGTSALTLYTRQEWVLPIEGAGISNRTVLRLMNSSNCEAIRSIEDIPVYESFERMSIFGKRATFYAFVPTETTRALAPGKYTVCMLPTASREWMYTGVSVNLLQRARTPTWYNYFSDEAEGNISSVAVQLPTKIVQQPNISYVYATKGAEMSMYLTCGAQPCPDRSRVIVARAEYGDSDPCLVDEFDFPGEYAQGPFVLHDGVLTLTANTTSHLFETLGSNYNWTLCVETGPSFWRQPQRPFVFLSVRETLPTQILAVPDDHMNSTFAHSFPNGFEFNVSAGGATKVLFTNGVGIRRGTMLRFGPNCDTSSAEILSESAAKMRNPSLLSEPIMIMDKRGAFFLKGSYYPYEEPEALRMCFASIDPFSGAMSPFMLTNVRLFVGPPTHQSDDTSGAVDISHTPQGALRGTIQLPCMSRGTIALVNLTSPAGLPYSWTAGSILMLSRDCNFNTEGTALLQVDSTLNVAVTRNHTRLPTRMPLRVCIRRLLSFETLTDTGVVTQARFETSAFVDTGFRFQVAAVVVSSVSLSAMRPLDAGENADVRFVVAVRSQEDLMLELTLLASPAPNAVDLAQATLSDYNDGILQRMTNPAALVAFGMLKMTSGRPCSAPVDDADVATVRSLPKQDIVFSANETTVVHSQSLGSDKYVVNLKQSPAGAWGTPMNPKSLCLSADGGKTFVSVGIAVFDVEWAPALAIVSPNTNGHAQMLNEVNVYENTELAVEVVDARYSVHFNDLRDPTAAFLARFAELVLWDGFINNGLGIVSGMRLLLASSYIEVNQSSSSIPLSFTFDAVHADLPTGIRINLLPVRLQCAESGASTVYGHHLEPGATYDITPGVCAFGLNDGSMVRYAPRCSDAKTIFIGDGIITGSRLTSPATVAFIEYGSYEVCIKKYLAPAMVAIVGAEAEYAPTGLTLLVSSRVGVSAVNDVSSGTLAFFQNEPTILALSGSGIGNGNVIISFPKSDSGCSSAAQFVDGNGVETMSSLDPFAIWVGVDNNVGVLNATVTRSVVSGSEGKRLVCVSINDGITFVPVGKSDNPLYAMVVPPTVTSVGMPYDSLLQSSSVLSNVRVVTGANDTADTAPGPNTAVIPPLYYFDTDEMYLTGNGIGVFSQRSTPLMTAFFPSAQLESCNGPIDISLAVAIFDVDALTGRATLASSFAGEVIPQAPSQAYVICTSADEGKTFYSANGEFLPPSSNGVSRPPSRDIGVTGSSNAPAVEYYNTNPLVARFEEARGGNRREDDATLMLDTLVFSANNSLANFSIQHFDVDAIQSAFARSLGVSAGFVAVVVSPMHGLGVPNGFHIAVKLIGSAISTQRVGGGQVEKLYISPLDAYSRWVSIFTASGEDSTDALLRANLTASLESNMTANAHVAILRSGFACSDGWPASPSDTPKLMSISVDLVSTDVRGYGGQQEMGSTKWATIPILLLFPCFMVIATYFAYRSYFGVINVDVDSANTADAQASA